MNTEPSDCGSDMGNLIDRLVCGEIDESARGRLIAWLEAEPTRWRLCGLAFLEAQMWQDALRGGDSAAQSLQSAAVGENLTGAFGNLPKLRLRVSRNQNESDPQLAGRTINQRPRRTLPTMRSLSAVAAAVLVAFGLGLTAGSLSPWTNKSGPETLVTVHPPGKSTDETESGQLAANAVTQGNSRSSAVQTYAVLKIATKDAGTREIQLPVVDGATAESRWLQAEPEALPESVQKQLEQRGYQLQQRRQFVEVQLEDGRRAVIPVDQYQVKFVGGRAS